MEVELLVIGLILGIGACVQGAIGFGLGMLSAPLVALIAPELLPGTILLLALVLSTATFLRERSEIEWRVVGWVSLARIPGSIVGAVAVVLLPVSGLSLVLAAAVIFGVIVSIMGWKPGHGTTSSLVAGFSAGVLGTATSIGGPPLSLILRGLPVGKVRGTMGAAFVVGTLLSIVSLVASGVLNFDQLRAALLLLPAVVIGFLLSNWVNRFVNSRQLYIGSVVLSLLGATVVVGNSLVQLL